MEAKKYLAKEFDRYNSACADYDAAVTATKRAQGEELASTENKKQAFLRLQKAIEAAIS